MPIETAAPPLLWAGFIVFVLAMLAIDLGIFHRSAHKVSVREALTWTVVWITLAMVFNLGVYFWFGPQRALEFLTGYIIEKALSVDNIFVFLVLFSYFSVPAEFQYRVLFWGILGALAMRATFILLGAVLLQQFHWVAYIFGAFLIYTGIRLFSHDSVEVEPDKNPLFRAFRRAVPSTSEYRGSRFFVVENGKRFATPLLVVLVAIEATDLVFAVDSIPAIFAVTRDPFIVFTSNIFAILGLRALYFVLASALGKFHYLNVGLALVLVFIGVKMLISEIYRVPTGLALGIVALLLGGSVLASLFWAPAGGEAHEPSD